MSTVKLLSENNLPKTPSLKYLRRGLALHICSPDETKTTLKMINKKRLHIKNLFVGFTDDPKEHLICLKKKLFKNLLQAEFCSFPHDYWLQDLKHAKKLIKCRYEQDDHALHTLQRINKNLEFVNMIHYHGSPSFSYSIKKLYKAVGSLRKLKVYHEYRYPSEHHYHKEDFQACHRYLARLPNVAKFESLLNGDLGQAAVRDLMSEQGKTYEKLTKLLVDVSSFFDEQSEVNIEPFFQFQMFPNLRELCLKATAGGWIESDISRLGPFVPKAFGNLTLLEKFSLHISSQLPGVDFIFEGLLELPQLISFSFHADFLELNQWNPLAKFIQNQKSLTNLCFAISACDPSEEYLFKDFLENLSYRPKLQSLSFWYFDHDLLPAFSNGLERVIGTENIKYLSIDRSVIETELPAYEPLGGLCEFLMKNRKTLTELKINVPSPLLQDPLGNVISQLKQLKNLHLVFCEEKFSDEQRGDSSLNFEEVLENLVKLEDLSIDFRSLKLGCSKGTSQLTNFFKALTSLKNLRVLQFQLPRENFEVPEAEMEIISRALKELKYVSVRFANYINFDETDTEMKSIREISRILERLWKEQALKVSSSF